MIDGSVLQSAQRCFEKKSRVAVKMVVNAESAKPVRLYVVYSCFLSVHLKLLEKAIK